MPAKINVTSHISLHTWSSRTKFFQNPDGREPTLATGHQDEKNTYEPSILCSLTFKVFQKKNCFRIKHLRPPSPKRPVAETSRRRNVPSPKGRRRTVLDQIQVGRLKRSPPLKPVKITFFTIILYNYENRISDIRPFAGCCFVRAVM